MMYQWEKIKQMQSCFYSWAQADNRDIMKQNERGDSSGIVFHRLFFFSFFSFFIVDYVKTMINRWRPSVTRHRSINELHFVCF